MRIDYHTMEKDHTPEVNVWYAADEDILEVEAMCSRPAMAELVELVYLDLVKRGDINLEDHL